MRIAIAVFIALAIAGPAFAQARSNGGEIGGPPVQALPAGSSPRPVALTRLKAEFRADQDVGTILYGVICIQPQRLTWRQAAPLFVNLKDVFGEELVSGGFKPESQPGNLFADRERDTVDLEVGALIKGMDASYCQDIAHSSGKIKLDIEWQIYSSLQRHVLATIETHETAQKSKGSMAKNEGRSLPQMAFAANVRALLADQAFREIVTSPAPVAPKGSEAATAQAAITLTGAANGPTSISDAVGSVVSVFAGDGFGSGVLVSKDGYILTNQHVVGAVTTVRLRWSDGLETTGQVERSDRGRDVALVKTDGRGRTPLALNRSIPPQGATVFAIGTPLDPHLQSTVTRGIISASRILNGFSFIQSDTPVSHGNSGGPLLDEHGAVIGLTDMGIPPEKGSSLNFFIPIGDALDILQLQEVEADLPPPSPPPQRAAAASKSRAKP